MPNNVDTYLELLQKRSGGEADSRTSTLNVDLADRAMTMSQTEVRSAWSSTPRELLAAANVDVFLVEDDPSMITLVRVLLKAEGIEVLGAENCREAIAALRGIRPRLLLVDLGLPDGSGLEVARAVRGWQNFPRIPVIALTVSSEKAGIAWQAGFSGFIPKPFAADTFRSMVTSWLSAPPQRN